jgi:hypothetical protein
MLILVISIPNTNGISFVDRDALMHFHYGLGVGHVYSHEAKMECSSLTQQAIHTTSHMTWQPNDMSSEREETTTWKSPSDNEDEDDEENDHIGIEEPDFFDQERNGSTESLIDALDDMFTRHVFNYEN